MGFFEDIVFWFEVLWWLWLLLVAWWLYKWAEDHLAFSPIMTLVVAFILIWYLVLEYPVAGSMGFLFYVLFFSGILWVLPYLLVWLPGFKQK
ncbi:MAG: hypothetical protein ACE5DI_01785 [Candidatus Micrarchaeia archaeon]